MCFSFQFKKLTDKTDVRLGLLYFIIELVIKQKPAFLVSVNNCEHTAFRSGDVKGVFVLLKRNCEMFKYVKHFFIPMFRKQGGFQFLEYGKVCCYRIGLQDFSTFFEVEPDIGLLYGLVTGVEVVVYFYEEIL